MLAVHMLCSVGRCRVSSSSLQLGKSVPGLSKSWPGKRVMKRILSWVLQEIHYNQHGLLLLQGQGIYRLANNW